MVAASSRAENKNSLRFASSFDHTQGLSSHKYFAQSLKHNDFMLSPNRPAQHIAMCLNCPRNDFTSSAARVNVACRNQVEQDIARHKTSSKYTCETGEAI